MLLILLTACLAPIAPAQASEVVNLARLVITGKRLAAEPTAAERAQIQQLPTVRIKGPRSRDGVQIAAQPRVELKAL